MIRDRKTTTNALKPWDLRPPWEQGFVRSPRRIPLPALVQGEAICYGPDGATLYLTSECGKTASGACTPLFEVPVTGATPGPTPEP